MDDVIETQLAIELSLCIIYRVVYMNIHET